MIASLQTSRHFADKPKERLVIEWGSDIDIVDTIDTKVLLELVKDIGSDSEWFRAGTRKARDDGSNPVVIVGWCRTKATTATTTTTIIIIIIYLLLARPLFGKRDYRGYIRIGGGSWREYKTGCAHEQESAMKKQSQ
jgi:hypothetical protein